ncbi:histone H1-like [Silene latifolia]|uniref:histone H1-like n=1 Tax=Silene latifolia TaxID=37657 RepID=UPI003D774B6D
MAAATANKTVKKASAPKSSSKASPSHPPYIQMITEALVALKERTGSSHHAIVKHIEEEQKIKDLPSTFKKILSVQLKKFVANGKLVMVKKSFKLPPKTTSADKPKAAEKKAKKPAPAAAKTAKTTVSKPKAVALKAGQKVETKSKSLKAVKSPMKKKVAAVAKAKKPKSIKSPVKKVAAAAAAKVTTKKAKK